MWKRALLFLVLNFGTLALGHLLMDDAMTTEWYRELLKPSWMPPGWVFAAAWVFVMLCFSFFMARVTEVRSDRGTWTLLFLLQFIFNVAWNPIFFQFHLKAMSLTVLVLLLLILLIMAGFAGRRRKSIVLLLPYILWLFVALSLNGYILFNN